jgi:nucleoid DNA-binding protein
LKPTKGRTLIKKTAEDLNLPEALVQDVVDFYYSQVTKKIEGLKHTTLLLHGLGTLRMSRVKLKRDIEGLKKLLSSNDQEDFK